MDLRKWSKSEVEYGRKVLDSGLEGVRSGREAFLEGKPLTPFLHESVRKGLKAAAAGACLGALSGYPGKGHRSIGRILGFGLLGGAIGFGVAVAWATRRLTESAADAALRNVHRVRDEHWVEKHPVAYA
jgi:hypothetical protein